MEAMNGRLKDIKILTMVRNDRFLPKWVEYYSRQLGRENLYVFFDGEDQQVPEFCRGVNANVLPKMEGDVVATDRQRARFMSEQAARLMADGADMVIATDADEFLVPDPALKMDLRQFLSSLPPRACYSALGVDVLHRLPGENKIDFSRTFLSQRSTGWLYSRYTKASIITRPLSWGGGYHRVKGENFHIVKDLYLFHFGGVDRESLSEISADPTRVNNGWIRHQLKRSRALERISRIRPREWDRTVATVRRMQTLCRPIFALNKPTTFGLKYVVRIPERFHDVV